MKLFELFATIKLDDKDFTDGVKRSTAAGRQLGSSMDGLSIKAVALGTALYNAGVQAAKMAGSLVKTSIEAAATMQAETAQFNSAFGEMAGFATKALKNVEGETGILYTRLRTVGTKAFSQLKGAGLGAADAMSAMEEYTTLAADAAAYFDISLEEADAKLRSFMRGNTEAGESINLFTNEAQRNERAMEKYGKKWVQLTEAQKELLMLGVTREIYTQSGVIGQAAKEADSWANIMGNVGSAWTTLLGKFGAPVMEAVKTPIQNAIDMMISEDTQLKMEQAGLWLANGITALYDGEDSPIKQTIKFVGDIASAFSSEEGQSVLTAVGIISGAIFAVTHPVAAVATGVLMIATNWDIVKQKTQATIDMIKTFAAIDAPTAKETGDPTVADVLSSIINNGDLSSLTAEQRQVVYASGLYNNTKGEIYERSIGPTPSGGVLNYSDDDEEEVSYGDLFSNAKGLPYVPYDNYITRLHRGEQVVQANRAAQNRTSGTDASGLYGAILAAVREGVSNIAVNMDGVRVGTLVADTVSRRQAEKTNSDLRSRGYAFG